MLPDSMSDISWNLNLLVELLELKNLVTRRKQTTDAVWL